MDDIFIQIIQTIKDLIVLFWVLEYLLTLKSKISLWAINRKARVTYGSKN